MGSTISSISLRNYEQVVSEMRNYRGDRVPTSIMMANGTQQATAQEIPTKLTTMMA